MVIMWSKKENPRNVCIHYGDITFQKSIIKHANLISMILKELTWINYFIQSTAVFQWVFPEWINYDNKVV